MIERRSESQRLLGPRQPVAMLHFLPEAVGVPPRHETWTLYIPSGTNNTEGIQSSCSPHVKEKTKQFWADMGTRKQVDKTWLDSRKVVKDDNYHQTNPTNPTNKKQSSNLCMVLLGRRPTRQIVFPPQKIPFGFVGLLLLLLFLL
jgi:hypothetical protein